MDLHWVDVFASGPFTGNPLAVITTQAFPPPADMQAMAAELGLSETVFAVPGDVPALRIFTPVAEIPLAGHPLVGAAWVLRRIGWTGDDAVLGTPAGPVAVRADDTGATMTRTGPVPVGEADTATLARALGVPPAHLTGDRAPVWDAGLPQVMVEVHDLDALAPHHDLMRRAGTEGAWAGVSAYVLDPPAAGAVHARVRHFAAPIGIDEDPVTGSAAAALGACLAARTPVPDGGVLHLVVHQGAHMGRPGTVDVHVATGPHGPTSVSVGGPVVPVLTGAVGPGTLRG